ncbi:iron-containing alcohol dehydrogenase [Patulibacter sp. NPDC049589]|uniref:iron-containing alcohol dehydrogenase n=1 Tax=Patulibacter sp. NPDC049589 TaxID=3154731 RepID=UPI00341A013B
MTRTLVLLDRGVAPDGALPAWITADVPAGAVVVPVEPATADAAPDVGCLTAFDTVWAVGGGRVLDLAKRLAVAVDPVAAAVLRRPGRSGLVALGEAGRRRPRLVAVPTTLGTGSECSPTACLTVDGQRRLAVGDRLRPDVVVRPAAATAGLPGALERHGVVEALLRAIGPYVGSGGAGEQRDARALRDAARLAALADHAARRRLRADERRAVALLSGATHERDYHRGRSPFSHRAWYLANELSSVTGIAKIPATAVLLPALWARAAAGDERWGRADAIARAYRAIGADPHDASAPRERLTAWRAMPDALPPVDLEALARRTVRAWGGGLPALAGLRHADVLELLRDALPPGPGTHDARPATGPGTDDAPSTPVPHRAVAA